MKGSICVCVLSGLLLCGGVQAEELVPPAAVHNEYNNSTIYYGTQREGAESYSSDEYGIRTYRDPETGDRVTSVRSPRPQNQQQAPVYIEPVVRPDMW